MGYSLHRSMSAMRYAEAIVYIQICQGSQLLSKFHIVLFLFLMEAQVFQEQDMAGLELFSSSLSICTYAVRSEKNFFTQQLAQMLGYRSQAVFGVHLSFRTTKMCHQNNGSLVVQKVLNSIQGRTNTSVIGNFTFVIKGYIEIYTHQHLFAGYI